MIASEGYKGEIYEITTEDNYLLDIYRIPSDLLNPKIVFAMHGLYSSASDYLIFGKNYSLGKFSFLFFY